MNMHFEDIADKSLRLECPSRDELLALLRAEGDAYDDLLYLANRVRRRFKADRVEACSVISAKQGLCSEDCKFCAQAARHRTGVATFPLVAQDVIEAAASEAARAGASGLGIVISGKGLRGEDEIERMLAAIRSLRKGGKMRVCASLGALDDALAQRLRDAGLERCHHNLETSRRFFPQICTTHTYDDRLATLHTAARAGMELCSGALFGLGESDEDRVDLALELRGLGVASVPLNFLNPVPGTPLESAPPLPPRTILKTIAMFRLALPDKDIRVCGGRERNLRDLQSWMFYAGANATMVGNYLTTTGRPAAEDLRMFQDLGLEFRRAE